jgi:hypothetical protein
LHGRYLDILENIEGRVQRYYFKREPRQLIPKMVPNDSLNSIVRSQDRCADTTVQCLPCQLQAFLSWCTDRVAPLPRLSFTSHLIVGAFSVARQTSNLQILPVDHEWAALHFSDTYAVAP